LTNELLALQASIRRCSTNRKLAYGGGVALNCCANTSLALSRVHDEIWIMPCPGDAGTALGAALALEGRHARWTGPFLGHVVSRPPDLDAGLRVLLAGEPLALAHGRAEFGPRALGNRSLLIDPRLADGKDRLNAIKGRQPFRPFAAAVLEEHADDWFDLPVRRSPYMQYAAATRRPQEIPTAIHVDGTSRIQTVTADDNRVLHELLTRFHDATGVPILVNTSLNGKREPLVNSWADASALAERQQVALA
jgi:carbamoyltransferase